MESLTFERLKIAIKRIDAWLDKHPIIKWGTCPIWIVGMMFGLGMYYGLFFMLIFWPLALPWGVWNLLLLFAWGGILAAITEWWQNLIPKE